jgi:hypothetical protein
MRRLVASGAVMLLGVVIAVGSVALAVPHWGDPTVERAALAWSFVGLVVYVSAAVRNLLDLLAWWKWRKAERERRLPWGERQWRALKYPRYPVWRKGEVQLKQAALVPVPVSLVLLLLCSRAIPVGVLIVLVCLLFWVGVPVTAGLIHWRNVLTSRRLRAGGYDEFERELVEGAARDRFHPEWPQEEVWRRYRQGRLATRGTCMGFGVLVNLLVVGVFFPSPANLVLLGVFMTYILTGIFAWLRALTLQQDALQDAVRVHWLAYWLVPFLFAGRWQAGTVFRRRAE